MGSPRDVYDRFDGWARNLSRERYALFAAVTSFSVYLLVGTLLGDQVWIEAIGTGLTLGVLYYWMDPR